MNDALGVASRAVCAEIWSAFSIQNRFSEDRPGGVAGAKKQNVVVSWHVRFLNSLLVAAARTAARNFRFRALRFDRADKRAQELTVDLRGETFDIKSLACKKFARVCNAINASRLDVHLLKSSGGEFIAILVFIQGACDTSHPQQYTLPNLDRKS